MKKIALTIAGLFAAFVIVTAIVGLMNEPYDCKHQQWQIAEWIKIGDEWGDDKIGVESAKKREIEATQEFLDHGCAD
jgi:hypothetical protein